MNTRMGNRLNAGMTYLDSATRARPNLRIRGRIEVDTVIVEGNRATGVRLINGEELHAAEVILSAGTYGSPAILMRSGIGPGYCLNSVLLGPIGHNIRSNRAARLIPEKPCPDGLPPLSFRTPLSGQWQCRYTGFASFRNSTSRVKRIIKNDK
jgi:hypothetical protein